MEIGESKIRFSVAKLMCIVVNFVAGGYFHVRWIVSELPVEIRGV